MRGEVSNSDWKHFKVVRETALDRLCTRTLGAISKTAADEAHTAHERLLSIFEIVNESNQDVARCFDFLSRSRMLLQLVAMQSMNLIEANELEGFSEDLRGQLARLVALE